MDELLEKYAGLKPKGKAVILAVSLGFVAQSAYFQSIDPALTALQVAKTEETDLSDKLAKLRQGEGDEAALEASLAKATKELGAISARIPPSMEPEKLLAAFDVHAKEAGVALVSFSPRDTAVPGTVTGDSLVDTRSVGLEVEGRYADIALFLDKTLSHGQLLRVKDLDLKPASSGKPEAGAHTSLRARLTLAAFISQKNKDPAPAKPGESAKPGETPAPTHTASPQGDGAKPKEGTDA